MRTEGGIYLDATPKCMMTIIIKYSTEAWEQNLNFEGNQPSSWLKAKNDTKNRIKI